GGGYALTEYRLGPAGRQAVGVSATAPDYLAGGPCRQAAAELIRQPPRSGDLALPVGDLEQAASTAALEIARQVSASPEVTAVVRALEQQFDAFMRGANQETKATLTAQPVELPTAEEIGAAVEAFLADQVDQESLGGRTTELGTGPETAAERPADEAENASDEDGAPKQ